MSSLRSSSESENGVLYRAASRLAYVFFPPGLFSKLRILSPLDLRLFPREGGGCERKLKASGHTGAAISPNQPISTGRTRHQSRGGNFTQVYSGHRWNIGPKLRLCYRVHWRYRTVFPVLFAGYSSDKFQEI